MTWKAYRLTLRLLSPLHVGSQKIGNVQHCRRYLTGRTLWGALTARLTRDYFSATPADYKTVGERVNQELAFSYFYPAVNEGKDVWFPWDKTKSLEEFDWKFLGTYASTALADGRRALDASLHETEFIAPCTRDNQQVYLVGYVFAKSETDLPWRDVLNRLQLGAERRYGWGRVAVVGEIETCGHYFDFALDLEQPRPVLDVPDYGHLPAHLLLNSEKSLGHFVGQLEPFQSRIWKGKKQKPEGKDEEVGTGYGFSPVEICWIPGTRVKKSAWFRIGRCGILEIVEE